ncbi:MAG: hypothetical protein M3160_00110 [Candidatus Eremiobacteraeota bacterium]|nr:hypothetical protein [Candidatus Eremiobacteraeota bacterium]
MAIQSEPAPQSNGLATVLNVCLAPRDAFSTLREFPMWGWAFIIAAVLGLIGSLLVEPATLHAVQTGFTAQMAHDRQFAQMTPDKQKQALAFASMIVRFGWCLVPVYLLLAALVQTVIMLVANAIGRGPGTFKQFWAAAMNISVVTFGIAYLFTGLIAALRGPQSYDTTIALTAALPSAAWVAPHAGPKAVALLSAINPFSVWGVFLLATALLVIARASRPLAYGTAIFIILFSGAFAALFAK